MIKFHSVSAAEETKCTTDGKTVETSGIITEIFAMSIPVFINSLGDFGQLNEGAISLIERIRELTVLHVGIVIKRNIYIFRGQTLSKSCLSPVCKGFCSKGEEGSVLVIDFLAIVTAYQKRSG